MNYYRQVQTRLSSFLKIRYSQSPADIRLANRLKAYIIRNFSNISLANQTKKLSSIVRMDKKFDLSKISLLLALIVLAKYSSLLYRSMEDPIVKYKQFLDDNTTLNTLLHDSGALTESYKPPYLFISGLIHTVFAGSITLKKPDYEEEILKMRDGGQIKLQSLNMNNQVKGIVAVIPGVSGDGLSTYSINIARSCKEQNYGCIIINHRGCADTRLLTPLTYHGGSSFDAKDAFAYIQEKYPNLPLYSIGVSLGANILGKYLGDEAENSCLQGAVLICSPLIPKE